MNVTVCPARAAFGVPQFVSAHAPTANKYSSIKYEDIIGEKSLELDEETAAVRSMWRGLINQMLIDARSKSTKKEAIRDKAEALLWFDSEGFKEACALADYNAQDIREKIRYALDNDGQWRKPAGQGWRTKKQREEMAVANGN